MFGTNVVFWDGVLYGSRVYFWLNQIQEAASRYLGKFQMNICLSVEKYVICRDVVLGTCTCTRVILEYCFKVLVLVLVLVT